MTQRENILRAIRFEHPESIPFIFAVSEAVYSHYDPHALEDLFAGHPSLGLRMRWDLVPKRQDEVDRKHDYYDEFGIRWTGAIDGIRGVITQRPLEDLARVPEYRFPGLPVFDLEKDRENVRLARERGEFTSWSLPHGHTFLRLTDLCGYANTLSAMVDEDENLMLLSERLEAYNAAFVRHASAVGYDMMGFPEDLGMQVGPMISPKLFKKYLKPVYTRLMKPARDSGAVIQMHSDGDIRTLADDLIDSGVDVLNLQDLVNGIDWIRERFFGKYCVDLDIDRQKITVFGTPKQVDDLIREEVEKLSSPAGGLMLIYGWYPGTPLENIRALMNALEKYTRYWD